MQPLSRRQFCFLRGGMKVFFLPGPSVSGGGPLRPEVTKPTPCLLGRGGMRLSCCLTVSRQPRRPWERPATCRTSLDSAAGAGSYLQRKPPCPQSTRTSVPRRPTAVWPACRLYRNPKAWRLPANCTTGDFTSLNLSQGLANFQSGKAPGEGLAQFGLVTGN